MSKRKAMQEPKHKKFEGEEESSSDEEADSSSKTVDVDFEFFDPQQVDFHGLKNLMRQLLDTDADLIDLSALADMILAQPLVGSTIKVDTNDSDPFAVLTVLNLREHKEKNVIQQLTRYIIQQATKVPTLAPLAGLLDPSSDATVGLILTERMHGMPTQLVPPMYKMMLEEVSLALKDEEPYAFTHYLILSKTYIEVVSKLDQEDDRPKKKKKAPAEPETFYYHPEDECLHQNALAFGSYNLVKEAAEGDADARRVFQDTGTKPQGHMILIEGDNMTAVIQALEVYVQG